MTKRSSIKSCKNCKNYDKGYCSSFRITITSISNAKVCSKYKSKSNIKLVNKKRKRCNTCEYFGDGATLYRCKKRNKTLTYTALMYCNSYKKKVIKG